MAVVGALLMIGCGLYLALAGGPEYNLLASLLLVIGLVLLPVNIVMRRRGIRTTAFRNPFDRR